MDNRDEYLLDLLENNTPLQEQTIGILICILSKRRFGPNTINGISVAEMNEDYDTRVVSLNRRVNSATLRALQAIKASEWYRKNRWPIQMPDGIEFCQWVDRLMESTEKKVKTLCT